MEARITNHDTKPRTIRAELRVPQDWKVLDGSGEVTIGARSDGRVKFRATSPSGRGDVRQILGIAITSNGQSFGELAEAIVDVVVASP